MNNIQYMGTQFHLSDETLVYAQEKLGMWPDDVQELTTENPYIPAVIEILAKRARRILEMEHKAQLAEVKDMFPEGTNMTQLPQHVFDSSIYVQKKIPLEQQSKISYYEKGGEWFINLNGIKISLQNESAEHNPKNDINVVNGHTYFSQPAAFAQATNKGGVLPTNALWIQIANFLWFRQLRAVLQIPLTGLLLPNRDLEKLHIYGSIWSAGDRRYLGVAAADNGWNVFRTDDALIGRSVRLLDN